MKAEAGELRFRIKLTFYDPIRWDNKGLKQIVEFMILETSSGLGEGEKSISFNHSERSKALKNGR